MEVDTAEVERKRVDELEVGGGWGRLGAAGGWGFFLCINPLILCTQAWRREQMATGAVKANANFQPLVGDWRERVQRAKKASGGGASESKRKAGKSERPRLSEDAEAELSAASKGLPRGWKVQTCGATRVCSCAGEWCGSRMKLVAGECRLFGTRPHRVYIMETWRRKQRVGIAHWIKKLEL